ncbi:dicarboxylate/amino acid:cation symporter [Pararobbsia alpina]|uniref:C4-dicarboxylate transport protein n=1 Tax=Pararobbsia alpina TaxID=621374 RepID=A0A6S7B870_9BURK|nr:cation:dicarboxylase symporter family transporter [Pararobbsia alpina]CAB3780661.1 C4-dicarboxylate transport protein [Pararobbsia alpina]
MKAWKSISNSTLALLVCFVMGAIVGIVAAPVGAAAYFVGQLYLSVVNMAAVPLLVVAMFFGLRQLLAMSRPGVRIGTMLMLAVVLVALCAAGGVALAAIAMPGQHLSSVAHARLGELVLQSTSDTRVVLFGHAASSATVTPGGFSLGDLVPDNFYHALAQGRALGILTGTILFGMAFAALSSEQTPMLNSVFEGIYRALESVIGYANLLLPVLAFGMAAHLSAHVQRATIDAMSGFLLCFVLSALLLSALALAAIARQAGTSFGRALTSLKTPMLVGLASGSATAPIPHTIEAMSTRLGFSRGVAELVVPFGSVFVRAGSALYFALAAVFVANLYDRPIGMADIVVIGVASTVAALMSAGQNGVVSVGYIGVVLSLLQLPVEAAGVLFITIDVICEGPRNLLSLLSICTVVALVSAGLPSERTPLPAALAAAGARPVFRFTFSRAQLVLAMSCVVAAASLIVLMGIGVGAK